MEERPSLLLVIHGIKNHLATMRILVKLLSPAAENSPYSRYLDLLAAELDATERLILDSLDTKKRQPADLKEVIDAVIDLLRPNMTENAVNVDVNIPEALPKICCNPIPLSEAIRNLVQNALEASPKGGRVTIQASLEKDGRHVTIHISDQGSGIPGHLLSQLPSPFLTTKPGGLGLGLTISQAVARQHGSNLQIESGQSGTHVSFGIPACRPPGLFLFYAKPKHEIA